MEIVNLAEKFSRITDYWNPRIAGELNDSYVKLVKLRGEFVWHHHEREDELFLVIAGRMRMQLRDGDRDVGPGELVIVPRGVEHKPSAIRECRMMLIEPAGTPNTGDAPSDRTAADNVWV